MVLARRRWELCYAISEGVRAFGSGGSRGAEPCASLAAGIDAHAACCAVGTARTLRHLLVRARAERAAHCVPAAEVELDIDPHAVAVGRDRGRRAEQAAGAVVTNRVAVALRVHGAEGAGARVNTAHTVVAHEARTAGCIVAAGTQAHTARAHLPRRARRAAGSRRRVAAAAIGAGLPGPTVR